MTSLTDIDFLSALNLYCVWEQHVFALYVKVYKLEPVNNSEMSDFYFFIYVPLEWPCDCGDIWRIYCRLL